MTSNVQGYQKSMHNQRAWYDFFIGLAALDLKLVRELVIEKIYKSSHNFGSVGIEYKKR